jgi:hypothetical protein
MKATISLIVVFISLINAFSQTQTRAVLRSSDSTIIKTLIKQLEELQKQNVNNSSNINALLAGKDFDANNKYTIIKQNVTNAVTVFQLLNSKINILKAKASADKLDVFIKDLNNPQSNALGFKLDETIIKLINQNIQPKKKNLGKKIIDNVSSITKSPIVTSIPVISPAISVANSVLSILRSTNIMEDEVDLGKINAFETALNNYIQYYVALNDGNTGFTYNLANQTQELGLLQQKLYDQVVFFVKTLSYPIQTKSQNEDLGLYLNNLFKAFNRPYIDKLFSDVEKNNTINGKVNYDAILDSNMGGNLKDVNNKLEEFMGLISQFEFQYTSYFNIYEVYNSKILAALDIAGINKIADETLVKSKKAIFNDLKNTATTDIKTSLNLDELSIAKQSIKYTARIL